MDIRAGFSRAPITPSKPMPMAGFDKRLQFSEGVHDELYVSCLTLETANGSLALLSMDVLGVDRALDNAIRKRLADECEGLRENGIFICATHNHSGPSGIFEGKSDYDGDYVGYLVRQSAESCRQAVRSLQPARLYGGSMAVPDIASRRNVPEDRAPLECDWLRIQDVKGKTILLVNFPCHMTVLDENNRLFSRDMLAGVQQGLSEGGTDALLYINGAAGDISTRFHKKEASFAEAQRLGRSLAQAVLRSVENGGRPLEPSFLKTAESSFSAVCRRPLTGEEKTARKRQIEELLRRTGDSRQSRDLQSALLVLARPDRRLDQIPGVGFEDGRYVRAVTLRMAELGNIGILSAPFELYYETGVRLKGLMRRKFHCDQVLLAGYCGGYEGYLPPSDSFDRIGYETEAGLFERDTESKLLAAVENM